MEKADGSQEADGGLRGCVRRYGRLPGGGGSSSHLSSVPQQPPLANDASYSGLPADGQPARARRAGPTVENLRIHHEQLRGADRSARAALSSDNQDRAVGEQ